MYSVILSNCDTLTLKAPYFSCHAKSRCSGKLSCTHLDEPPLIICSALAIARVEPLCLVWIVSRFPFVDNRLVIAQWKQNDGSPRFDDRNLIGSTGRDGL